MVRITMDVDPKDEDSTTKQVIDYYKKYSQNRELPKYFSGTSLSYLPEIKGTASPEAEIKTFVHTNINIVVTTEDENPVTENVEERMCTSGASSPTSNHKLEWDSGADIGYNNCQERKLRKSSSLPIITDIIKKKSNDDFGPVTSNAPVTRSESSSSDGNVKIVLLTCSSSSEYHSDENKCSDPLQLKKKVNSSSSSSDANDIPNNTRIYISSSDSSNKQSVKQFASTLSYLKQKIGLPDAHSTPKNPDECKSTPENKEENTPLSKKSLSSNKKDNINTAKAADDSKSVRSKSEGKKLIKKPNVLTLTVNEEEIEPKNQLTSEHQWGTTKYQNQKVVNLVVTKPITVECTSSNQNLTHKSLQTVIKQSTVAVQTDEISRQELAQAVQVSQRNFNNQSLMYFEYSDSDKTSGRSTQTNSIVLESNCDSFEYLAKEPVQVKSGILKKSSSSNSEIKSNSKIDPVLPQQEQVSNVKEVQKVCESSSVTEENSSSKDFCLGNLVSAGLLGNVEEDIGKCVYLLQRLLKSKKYDPVTKKRYIKKIIKRITESKYLEESSTSSDLFVPKKLPKTLPSGDKSESNLLQSNLPWHPVAADQIKLSPRRKKLVQKTFTQDFVPGQNSSKEEVSSAPEIVPINSRDTRKNRFTLTNNEFSVNRGYSTSTEKSNREKTISETDSTSLEKHYESSSTSKSYQNWREDKTLSERILEKQSDKSYSSNGNGDCVVKFADREREFQINWIKNEISHLGKLKGLLEKPSLKHRKAPSMRKITNVYTVSNENAPESKHKRNYIIETMIGTQSSSEMNFKLDGQVYTVQEYLNSRKKREQKKSRQVTGNIEVVSSDSTTNIKVTTFCEECKRSPCTCNLPDYEEGCACNRDGAEICGSQTCICQGESLVKISSTALLQGAASRDLKGEDYVSPSSSSGSYEDCTCYVCKKYPCICDTKYKELGQVVPTISNDDMSGMFIPVVPARPTTVKFSTFPPTSKEENERKENYTSTSLGRDIVDRATGSKTVSSQNEQATSYGSLRKVFENCACTQTDCTCDFVQKLMSRFSKTDIPSSTNCRCDNKYQQTEKFTEQSVGLQTFVNTQSRNQQTSPLASDDISLQTEKIVNSEHKNVGLQSQSDTYSQKQQTTADVKDSIVQTESSKMEDNYQNIGIQAKANVRDQILQTSRSLDEQENVLKNNVATHISVNGESQTKGVTFVDDSVSTASDQLKRQEATASQTVQSVGTSYDNIKKQDAMTSPITLSVNTSPNHITKKITPKQNFVDPFDNGEKSSKEEHFVGASDNGKLQAASQTMPTQSQSDSSEATSSKGSSSSNERNQVLCVCCCTQTESKSKSKIKKRNARVQMDSSEHSDKENAKRKSDSLTTSSTTYEICPSILVSSYNNTSQSVSDGSSKPTLVLCFCCKEKYPSDKISVLGSKTENYPICCNCLAQRPILTAVCYAGPEENCPCSKPSTHTVTRTDTSENTKKTTTDSTRTRTDTSDNTKKTTTDSNDMEEYCTCTKPFQFKNSKYCPYCLFKLRNTARTKNGIAYTLTLESDCLNKIRRKIKKTPLEEIKLKVPSPSSKKKRKDKENVTKRNKDGKKKDKERTCGCGNVICTRNCHVHGVSNKHKGDNSKRDSKKGLTLQQHLQKNRPDFIESAESRRNVVVKSRSERELGGTDAKLKFVEENAGQDSLKKRRKLFTEQEMKEITKRNYKKLPEVKEKINSEKEQRLRDADRFIVDVFARKIRHSVLKGKSSFPIDSNVICLPKTCNC